MVRAVVALAALMLATLAVAQAAPPTCQNAQLTILPDAAVVVPQHQCTDPDGDTFDGSSFTPPGHGTINPGARTYPRVAGSHGPDEFTFKVTDNQGERSAPATVQILIDTAP